MDLHNGIGDQAIENVIRDYPYIGDILYKYEIGCVTCNVGICLLKDVVAIHSLGDEVEAKIENEINTYLAARDAA